MFPHFNQTCFNISMFSNVFFLGQKWQKLCVATSGRLGGRSSHVRGTGDGSDHCLLFFISWFSQRNDMFFFVLKNEEMWVKTKTFLINRSWTTTFPLSKWGLYFAPCRWAAWPVDKFASCQWCECQKKTGDPPKQVGQMLSLDLFKVTFFHILSFPPITVILGWLFFGDLSKSKVNRITLSLGVTSIEIVLEPSWIIELLFYTLHIPHE